MKRDNRYWMDFSINISKSELQKDLRVGVVLVSDRNELICSAYSGESDKNSWYLALMRKVQRLNCVTARSIYLTINTVSSENIFDLSLVLSKIRISEIFVGLPDPKLTRYDVSDPIVTRNNIHRYPDELQKEILKQNSCFFCDSKQSIKYNNYYSENRISKLVIKELKLKGFNVSTADISANRKEESLSSLICKRYGIKYSEGISTVHRAIAKAFDNKYGIYDYSKDARSVMLDWKKTFMTFYESLTKKSMSTINILNVGVGDGREAVELFSDCLHVTFVDIAKNGLEKIKTQLPLSTIINSGAVELSNIPSKSYDLYVSLRTYNSAFFDIKNAIFEAHRVLKANALIIISIANGFSCSESHSIIPGLLIPETEFVDIYRGLDTAKIIQTEFYKLGFKNIRLFPTNTELYLSATT